jgi:hypothetical protein
MDQKSNAYYAIIKPSKLLQSNPLPFRSTQYNDDNDDRVYLRPDDATRTQPDRWPLQFTWSGHGSLWLSSDGTIKKSWS